MFARSFGQRETAGQMKPDADVVIVGAGIGGLTLAYYLGVAGKRVTILEQSNRVGGWLRSERRGELLLEFGPNSTLAKPALVQLIGELGLESEVVWPAPIAKIRYFALANPGSSRVRLVTTPRTPLQALLTPILPWWAKLRVLAEPLIHERAIDDESVYSFISRRFGSMVAERIVSPVLSGIWAAEIKRLSARTALRFPWQATASGGSVLLGTIRGMKGKARERLRMLSFKEGMEQLALALRRQLVNTTIEFDTNVLDFEFLDEGVRVITNRAEVIGRELVLTTDAKATARLLSPHAGTLGDTLSDLSYASIGIVHLVVRKASLPSHLGGFGVLVSPAGARAILGIIFSSMVFPHRASGDESLLTCFVGGAVRPECADVTDEQVRTQVLAEVREILGITGGLEVLAATFHRSAIPNYPVGHFRTLERLEELEQKYPRLKILANWREGLGMSDRIENASLLATRLLARTSSGQTKGLAA